MTIRFVELFAADNRRRQATNDVRTNRHLFYIGYKRRSVAQVVCGGDSLVIDVGGVFYFLSKCQLC